MYQCVAGNKHGEVYSNAELRVIGKVLAWCVYVCASVFTLTRACILYVHWHGDVCASIHLFIFVLKFALSSSLLNTARWPPASLLLATNWKALIIRWMHPADSDVCQSCSVHQPRPSALSSLSLSTVWQQLSFTIHPPTCLILIIVLIGIRLNTAQCTSQTQGRDSKKKSQGQYQTAAHLLKRAHIFNVFYSQKVIMRE